MSEITGVNYDGMEFKFYHTATSDVLVNEIFNDNYRLKQRGIEVRPGDVIVDIGANEGFFSILMAKKYPNATIISFEPVPRTFFQMVRNIGLNGVTNIMAYMKGIWKPGIGNGVMNVHKVYSGGSSLVDTFNADAHDLTNVELMPLDNLFDTKFLPWMDRIRILKMDIEGGEYAALYNSSILPRVDYFVGEFHINSRLQKEGYDITELATWVGSQTNLVYYEKCKMAE